MNKSKQYKSEPYAALHKTMERLYRSEIIDKRLFGILTKLV